ncbi:unnamed protein product, partial [Allacma fusca]
EILAGSDIIFAKNQIQERNVNHSYSQNLMSFPHLKKGQQIELPTVVLFVLH